MSNLEQLAVAAGLSPNYYDIWGNRHTVPHDTLIRLLDTLGLPAHDEAAQHRALEQLNAAKNRPLPQVTIADENRKTRIAVPNGLSWTLTDEKAAEKTGDVRHDEIILPPLSRGYYRIDVKLNDGDTVSGHLLVAPPACWLPDKMAAGKKIWGIAAQLYALRSAQNLGIGDFGDLAALTEKSAALGADLVGINPPSALFLNAPDQYSPYSPSNRLLLNPLYIDVTAIEGFAQDPVVQKAWNDPTFQTVLAAARAAELVDYPAVNHLKQTIFQPLFAFFRQQASREKFAAFCREGGADLQRGALFEALHEHLNRAESRVTYWRNWPEAYRRPDSPETQAFAEANADRIEFYLWLQWLADRQLARAQSIALEKGMLIGVYRDLAVGCESNSAEAWQQPEAFLQGVSVGAPPDELNPGGQSWGLLPLNPAHLRKSGYQPFINLLRANMRHSRALRIDHVFGLARLFLIPHGQTAKDGAYLDFPLEELLAILRIESHRNQCLVIGEDLGTCPPNYREPATAAGLLSYKIFYFEHDAKGGFLPPHRYAPMALAAASTHDLATLRGWWNGADLKEKLALSLYPSDFTRDMEHNDRERQRPLMLDALKHENLPADPAALPASAHQYLARSASAICLLQLEDILGLETQANLPGTMTERPNWRIRLPETIDAITAPSGPMAAIAPMLNRERAANERDCPTATYRLQFHKDFTFYDAAKIIPYLAELGVSHVYASPWLKSRPGSTHGYDITDHNAFNPELGGEDGYKIFIAALRKHGLKQILDFVPNHMGVGGNDNPWWLSTLEWGEQSPFAAYFDINWQAGGKPGEAKLNLPVLGNPYGDTLAAGDLTPRFDPAEGSISIWYHEHRFPVCPATYAAVLDDLPDTGAGYDAGERLKMILRDDRARHAGIEARLQALAADKTAMHALLERQAYRLAYWRVASSEINYRRFFDIHDLAGLRMERPEVFNATHALVMREIEAGNLHGLRIDHIDGLADPEAYCRQLRDRVGSHLYLLVEKILGAHEQLRSTWPIEGTTGYEQLNIIAGILIETRNEKNFDGIYRGFAGIDEPFERLVADAKTTILETVLLSELIRLSLDLHRIAGRSVYTRDYPLEMLQTALKEVLAWFPIYRTYVTRRNFTEDDRRAIEWAIGKARKESQLAELTVYDFIGSLLSLENAEDADHNRFARRFQQLSGPAMAKGLEDTTFYRFYRLLALNEVGGNPANFGLEPKSVHLSQEKRAQLLPCAMSATATHDTKRGEDMRARLCVLSEMPDEWSRLLERARKLNRLNYADLGGKVPSDNEEYFIYQTLAGSWPLELLSQPFDLAAHQTYSERISAYIQKALREAKRHTSWNNPQLDYEKAIQTFLDGILNVSGANSFLQELLDFIRPLAARGLLAGLSQTILKLTLPGVPDIYQGTEYWDFSLVDPDNRRPVDYAARHAALPQTPDFDSHIEQWHDGLIKQQIIHRLLTHRRENPGLYRFGVYQPEQLKGKTASQFLAFSRKWQGQELIVVIPIRFAALQNAQAPNITLSVNGANFFDVIRRQKVTAANQGAFKLDALLKNFPFLVLMHTPE